MHTPLSIRRGFTLIELLVVIAIIGILSSVAFASLALAKSKAIDTHKKDEMASVRTALQAFNLDKGRMPHNYDCSSGTCLVNDSRATLAIEDVGNAPQTESGMAFHASMQELVSGKYLTDMPRSPGGSGYSYYDYGAGSPAGAVIATTLDAATPSSTGAAGSCRPFAPPLTFLDTLKKNLATAFTPVALAAGLINGGVITLPPTCILEVNGVAVEGPCPPSTTNICSTAISSDYCLCSTY